jgi:tetratricopeptide (TPR) repeat protein
MSAANHARLENRPSDAHRDYAAAVAVCRDSGSRRELALALKGLGQIERDAGNGEIALRLYEEAAGICRERDDQLALAHTIRHIADIHLDAQRAELAGPGYLEAIAIYRANPNTKPLDLANAIRPFAKLNEDMGKVAEARRLWAEARDLYATAGVSQGVAESSRRLTRLNATS